jgi:preprotein translocase subunit SecE
MAKQGDSQASTFMRILRDLLSVGLYKRSQGRIARQATFAALVIGFALGAWSLHTFLEDQVGSSTVRFAISAAVLAVGVWVSYRIVNITRFAEFLIAVEAEMNKVSWPSRAELIRSSAVVIVTMFGLAVLLFGYDLFWQTALRLIGVLPGD